MDYLDAMLEVIRALEDHDVEYVIVGGAAMNFHGLLRATEDIDIFVAPKSENIERLKKALRDVWDDPDIDEIHTEDLCGNYPIVRYGPPGGHLFLDIMTRIGQLAEYDDLEWERVELRGVPVRVATPATLYSLKRDTLRPIDRRDAARLADAFDLGED